MNLPHLNPNLTLLLTATVMLLLLTPSPGIAQDTTATLSGRVVDVKRNPVADLPISIQPFVIINGEMGPAFLLKEFMPEAYAPLLKSRTDEAGQFSVTGIKPGPIQFVAKQPDLPGDGRLPPDFDIESTFARTLKSYPSKLGQ